MDLLFPHNRNLQRRCHCCQLSYLLSYTSGGVAATFSIYLLIWNGKEEKGKNKELSVLNLAELLVAPNDYFRIQGLRDPSLLFLSFFTLLSPASPIAAPFIKCLIDGSGGRVLPVGGTWGRNRRCKYCVGAGCLMWVLVFHCRWQVLPQPSFPNNG